MAKIGVRLKIDVKKILKEWLFSGKKGTYLDATTFIDLTILDEYGNSGMITQDVPKNINQDKGPILGNSSVFWVENGQAPSAQAPHNQLQNDTPVSSGGFQQQPQQQGGFGQPQQQQGHDDKGWDDDIGF